MTANEAIEKLRSIRDNADTEAAHGEADEVLCELIRSRLKNGAEVVEAYGAVEKWYA